MNICIILNGEIKDYKEIKSKILNENYDYIICCDGGSNHAYNMDLKVDYIIGDLDSIKEDVISHYKSLDVKFKQFPTKKDQTDMELGIYLASTLKAKRIDFIGALGGRIDHTIANINILSYIKDLKIEARIISEKEIIYFIRNEKINIKGEIGELLSIIPINNDAKNITLEGLEYPLKDATMKYSLPLGISNVFIKNECMIQVLDGSLLIIHNLGQN